MFYITGDCHGNFDRFQKDRFPAQTRMTKNDYMIICGDFGGIWSVKPDDQRENQLLDWLDSLPFTTLFVCGNHENFDRLYRYPVEVWKGGKIHRIRNSVIHLMRGQVFLIDGLKFFTFGGGTSHDVQGGILQPDDPAFMEKYESLKNGSLPFRINHISWWKQELPSEAEMSEGFKNLARHNMKVDYIITHSCASSTLALFSSGRYKPDSLSLYLEKVHQNCSYKKWFFGHYHANRKITDKEEMLMDKILRLTC